MVAALSFGDPVMVRGAAGVGLIAELRRGDGRVLFLREGRSLWVELREMRRATHEEVAGTVEKVIHDLLRTLDAVEMEATLPQPARCRLQASHGAISHSTVDRVRAMLGGRLLAYVIRPQGMHRIRTVIEFTV